jgi:hypothetical protein
VRGAALPAVFQAGPALVVLGTGRRQPAKLEMPLIEHSIPALRTLVTGTGAQCVNHIGHHGGGLPLSRRYPWVQVGIS